MLTDVELLRPQTPAALRKAAGPQALAYPVMRAAEAVERAQEAVRGADARHDVLAAVELERAAHAARIAWRDTVEASRIVSPR